MSNRRPCFLAGIYCMFFTLVSAQGGWPRNTPVNDTGRSVQQTNEALNNDPPPIYYRDKPSVLLFIDGDPIMTVDEELRMYRVLNTPHLIIKNHHDNRYYLYWDKYWYVSDSATYNYSVLKMQPEVIKLIDSLVKRRQRTALKMKMPPKTKPLAGMQSAKPTLRPQVIVTMQPAELIQTRGKPLYSSIPGTSLQYAANSTNDIFKDSASLLYYVLLSGRWYRAGSLEGPWTFNPADKLPADFSKIPAGSARAGVLFHVAGTDSARKAIAEASTPRVSRVNRRTAQPVVLYDGGAEFSSFSNTGLFVSENSNIPVVNVKDKYYALQNGVWFVSKEAIGGAWEVSTERPPDIDKVPPEHRIYHARFVYITDTTEEYVTTACTSGYANWYIQDSSVVWGSGWPYKSWYRRSYFLRSPTWGDGMKYAPGGSWTSRYDRVLYKPRDAMEP